MSDTQPFPSKPPGDRPSSGRGLKWALFLSLALNLLVIGALAGAAMRHRMAPPGPVGFDPVARFWADAPGAAEGRADRGAWRDRLAARTEDRAERAVRMQALSAALRADPFDASAVESLLAAERAAFALRLETGHAGFLDRLSGMSASERARFAERLERFAARSAARGSSGS